MLVTLVTVSTTILIPVFWRGGHLVMGGGHLHVRDRGGCLWRVEKSSNPEQAASTGLEKDLSDSLG